MAQSFDLVKVVSIDGVAMNPGGGDFTTSLYPGQLFMGGPQLEVQVAVRTDDAPVYIGHTVGDRTITVYHSFETEAALTWLRGFYSRDHGERDLIVTGRDGVSYTAKVAAMGIGRHHKLQMGEKWAVDGQWKLLSIAFTPTAAASQLSDITINSADFQTTVTNTGNIRSDDVSYTVSGFTSQVSATTGPIWGFPLTLVNRSRRPLTRHPICITDKEPGSGTLGASAAANANQTIIPTPLGLHTGLPTGQPPTSPGEFFDHAREVQAGRSRSDGNDVMAFLDGAKLDVYPAPGAGFNTDALRLWASVDLEPGWSLEINAASVAPGDTTIKILDTLKSVMLPPLPQIMVMESYYTDGDTVETFTEETVILTAVDTVANTVTVVRGARGNTAVQHDRLTLGSAGPQQIVVNVKLWKAHALDVVYGQSNATTPRLATFGERAIFLETETSPLSSNRLWSYKDNYFPLKALDALATPYERAGAWFFQNLELPAASDNAFQGVNDMFQHGNIVANSGIISPSMGASKQLSLMYVAGTSTISDGVPGGQLMNAQKWGSPYADRMSVASNIPFESITFDGFVGISISASGTNPTGQGCIDVCGVDPNGIVSIFESLDKRMQGGTGLWTDHTVDFGRWTPVYQVQFVYRPYPRLDNGDATYTPYGNGSPICYFNNVRLVPSRLSRPAVVWPSQATPYPVTVVGHDTPARIVNTAGQEAQISGLVVYNDPAAQIVIDTSQMVAWMEDKFSGGQVWPILVAGDWPGLPGNLGVVGYDTLTLPGWPQNSLKLSVTWRGAVV